MQQPMPQPSMPAVSGATGMDMNIIAELKAEIERLRVEQREAKAEASQQVLAAQVAAIEKAMSASETRASQQALEARVEAELSKIRAESRMTPGMNGNVSMEALGGLMLAALQKLAGTQIVSVQGEEKPALSEGGIVNGVVPGAITTTTTTTTVDASGRGEDKPMSSAAAEAIPNAEGLFNRKGRSKTDGYDVDNFYNFFDEQEKK